MRCLTTRSRALFVLLCLALCACDRVSAHRVRSNVVADRAIFPLPGDSTTDGTSAATGTTANTDTNTNANTNTNTNTNTANTDTNTATTNTATATTTQQTTETQQQTTATTAQNTGTTSTQQATSTQQTQTTATGSTSTNTQQNTSPTQQTQQQPTNSVVSTTDANGSSFVTTVFVSPTQSDSSTSSSSASASATSGSDNSSGGIGTGSIIGMSVAGGVAVIGVISFFIWKFTRKRYSDFDDEPIKWPELNAHNSDNLNYALPTTRALDAGVGAGAGLDSASEVNLSRNASGAGYTHSSFSQPSQYAQPAAADSTADLYAPGGDPYAVPPLPHLNPNQPYRDDPALGSSAAYYDPYRGPVPQTFNDAASVSSTGPGYGGEAIPMSNLAAGGVVPAGRRSPGPQMGLDMGRVSPQPPMAGRQSPGPSLGYSASNASSGYGARASPAPGAAMAGRASPGPGVAMSGRHSPGPGAAYGGGF